MIKVRITVENLLRDTHREIEINVDDDKFQEWLGKPIIRNPNLRHDNRENINFLSHKDMVEIGEEDENPHNPTLLNLFIVMANTLIYDIRQEDSPIRRESDD